MAFLDNFQLGTHSEFIKIVKVAMLKAASAIAGEDPAGLESVVATKRHNLAVSIFGSVDINAKNIALHIAALGTIEVVVDSNSNLDYTGASSLDADIEFTIGSVWDDRAGVTYAELNPA